MPTYTFIGKPGVDVVNWDDPTVWSGGVVPNGTDADVVFPAITPDASTSVVTIKSTESYTAHSVSLSSDFVELDGSLAVSGTLSLMNGAFLVLEGGALSFGALQNNGFDIQGVGQISSANSIVNAGLIVANDGTLDLTFSGFQNTGTLAAGSGPLNLDVTGGAGADPDYADGTLSGGTYQAYADGILNLNIGGIVSTIAANVILGNAGDPIHASSNGNVNGFDPATGKPVSLGATLTEIAAGGSLSLYHDDFGAMQAVTVAGRLHLDQGALYLDPALTIMPGGILDGSGTLSYNNSFGETIGTTVVNDGTIESGLYLSQPSPGQTSPFTSGQLLIQGAISGTGVLEVGAGQPFLEDGQPPGLATSTLELEGATAEDVLFADNSGTLVLDDPQSFTGRITAQMPGAYQDTITLDGIAYGRVTGENYEETAGGGTLTISEGAVEQTLNFTGSHTLADFVLSNGAVGSYVPPTLLDVSIACYVRGTLIRTDAGERAVETLRIGDTVTTHGGASRRIKWMGQRSYSGRFLAANASVQPILFRRGALAVGQPRRDLRVSPKHAMYLDGVLVPAECLVNGSSIVRDTGCREVEYFHVELDSHDVIWAEGTPSETFVDDDSRGMFHNAADYAALYPQPAAPAQYCAKRLEDGAMLAAIKARLDRRQATRPLRGRVDGWHGNALRGWAQDPSQPEAPVCLEVLVEGAVVAQTIANLFRQDLRAAGYGSGCHGFRVEVPADAQGRAVTVRRAADGAVLLAMDAGVRCVAA